MHVCETGNSRALNCSIKTQCKFIYTLKQATTPLTTYQALIRSGSIRSDPKQEKVIHELQSLFDQISQYSPSTLPAEPETEGPVGSFAFNENEDDDADRSSSNENGGFFSRLFGGGSSNKNKSSSTRSSSSQDEVGTYGNVTVPNGLYIHGTTGQYLCKIIIIIIIV